MLTRDDFNEHAYDKLIRDELIDQLETLLLQTDLDTEHPLITAYNYIIAYNSVPGEWEDGKYDLS